MTAAKKDKFRFCFLGAALLGPSFPDLQNAFQHFQKMTGSAISEYSRFVKILENEKDKSQKEDEEIQRLKSLDLQHVWLLRPDQRVEWAVRVAPKVPAFLRPSVTDLAQIQDAKLLDAGLWLRFRLDVPDLFNPSISWDQIRARMRATILRFDAKILLKSAHVDWWHWFEDPSFDVSASHDGELSALGLFLTAEENREEPRLRALFEARYDLARSSANAEEMESFDHHALAMLIVEYGESPRLAYHLSEADPHEYGPQKILLMQKLADFWMANSRQHLAADALSQLEALRVKNGFPADGTHLLEMAELEQAAKNCHLALQLYQQSRHEFEVQQNEEILLKIRLWKGLASCSETEAAALAGAARTRILEWSAEYYRRALEVGINSDKRDFLLEGYGRILEQLNFWTLAADVFESQFHIATEKKSQVQGLIAATSALAEALRISNGSDVRLYKRFLSLLSLLSRAQPNSPALRLKLQVARDWQNRLSLEQDRVITATLNEIEGGGAKP